MKEIILKKEKLRPKVRRQSAQATQVVKSKKIFNRRELVRAIMQDWPDGKNIGE